MPRSPGGALLNAFSVERASTVPIYRQLDAALRRLILDGTLAPGQKLPSTRELSEDLGVSRITVKTVYEQLVAEGYAQARTGAGTYVAEGLEREALRPARKRRSRARPADLPLNNRSDTILSSRATARHGETAPFRPGVPALDLFPVRLWAKYLHDATLAEERRHMSYGEACGNADLRRAVARHLSDARGMQAEAGQIVITSGAQQAFALIAVTLLNQGDTVWYEDPGHIAGRDVLRIMGAEIAPVPVDAEGLDLDHAIAHHPCPRLIFTTPSHQQPLGTTMSLPRRLALLNHAQETGAWIIEDDYDSEFRYRGRPLPALSALDADRRVFYVGTFSKSMFAAMRLGYVVVPPQLVDAFTKAKTLLGQSSSAVVEQALARFMEDGRFVDHIRRMRRIYRTRRDILHDSLTARCSAHLTPQPTDAGMHMLAWLKNGVQDEATHRRLLHAGIDSLPLSVYSVRPGMPPALVLGFTGVSEAQIPRLVERMARTLEAGHG